MARKPSISSAPCLVDAASRAISRTCASTVHRPAQCVGYSVCNEFAHGPGPATVWRATQEGRRVLWLNSVLYFHTENLPSSQATSPFSLFCANLDRKRQIWPAAWCGLHYVRGLPCILSHPNPTTLEKHVQSSSVHCCAGARIPDRRLRCATPADDPKRAINCRKYCP